jgi:large subunit ribosomal protein L21
MYAVMESGGKQYQVTEGEKVVVDYLKASIGDLIQINEIKMIKDDDRVILGNSLKNAYIKAEVINHLKGKKLISFKYKRRKGYRRKKGHRQDYTELLIKEINLGDGEG